MKHLPDIRLWIFLSVFILVSCAPLPTIIVNNINDTGALQEGSFLYALPQTIIDLQITAQEISVIPGPYEKYAEKYLGIQNVPVKAEKVWNITRIQLQKHIEADADFIYTVRGISDPDDFTGISRLVKDSLIIRAVDFSANQVKHYIFPPKTGEIQYTDLSVKRNFEAEKDIEVSMVMPDTNYVTRPSSRNALKEKTLEQKAEEAANFLIKLRKRRFKLVAGQYEFMPEGENMADALKELARIEREYLSLFIGKRTVTEIQKNYVYLPEPGKDSERIVLFRFSPGEGYVGADANHGIPVVLELKAVKKTRGLEQYKMPLKSLGNILHYRVADQVAVKVYAGEQIWAEAMYPIFQYGVMVPMKLTR